MSIRTSFWAGTNTGCERILYSIVTNLSDCQHGGLVASSLKFVPDFEQVLIYLIRIALISLLRYYSQRLKFLIGTHCRI